MRSPIKHFGDDEVGLKPVFSSSSRRSFMRDLNKRVVGLSNEFNAITGWVRSPIKHFGDDEVGLGTSKMTK